MAEDLQKPWDLHHCHLFHEKDPRAAFPVISRKAREGGHVQYRVQMQNKHKGRKRRENILKYKPTTSRLADC